MTPPIGNFLSGLAGFSRFPVLRLPLLTDQQNGPGAQGAGRTAPWSSQISNIISKPPGLLSYQPLGHNKIGPGDFKLTLNGGRLGHIDFNISNIRGGEQEQSESAFQTPVFLPGSKIFSFISNSLQNGLQDIKERFSPLR